MLLLFLVAGLETIGAKTNPELGQVTSWVWTQMVLYAGIGLYRIREAKQNLRQNREERGSMEPGLSLLYPWFVRILEPPGMICTEPRWPKWYELDPRRFQKYVEPGLILLIAVILNGFGHGLHALYLGFSALFLYFQVVNQEEVFYRARQMRWDAKVTSLISQELDGIYENNAMPAPKNFVVTRSLMRSDASFRQWKEQQATLKLETKTPKAAIYPHE